MVRLPNKSLCYHWRNIHNAGVDRCGSVQGFQTKEVISSSYKYSERMEEIAIVYTLGLMIEAVTLAQHNLEGNEYA